MLRDHLHLVDGKGTPLSFTVQAACKIAYERAILDYPAFDQAQLADWAEEVALAMDARGEAIQFPRRYAYMALRGKVRDWLRTGPGRVELQGVGADLEVIAGVSQSFREQTERKILFEQILPTLNERDRAILVLVLNEQSTASIATVLNVTYAAAAKAMQRVKDRVSMAVDGKRHKSDLVPEAGELCSTRGTGSES
jgi:RNA polymerase sigma factor (sigma-70 family)